MLINGGYVLIYYKELVGNLSFELKKLLFYLQKQTLNKF